jgi:hypothetical protein
MWLTSHCQCGQCIAASRTEAVINQLDPACERVTSSGFGPDEAAHAPAEDNWLGAGLCQRLGLQLLANPEHGSADFDAAQHACFAGLPRPLA